MKKETEEKQRDSKRGNHEGKQNKCCLERGRREGRKQEEGRGEGAGWGKEREGLRVETQPPCEWKSTGTETRRVETGNAGEKQRKTREKQAKNVTFQWNLETAQAVQIRRLLTFKRIDSA